jgi:hypothetical protein
LHRGATRSAPRLGRMGRTRGGLSTSRHYSGRAPGPKGPRRGSMLSGPARSSWGCLREAWPGRASFHLRPVADAERRRVDLMSEFGRAVQDERMRLMSLIAEAKRRSPNCRSRLPPTNSASKRLMPMTASKSGRPRGAGGRRRGHVVPRRTLPYLCLRRLRRSRAHKHRFAEQAPIARLCPRKLCDRSIIEARLSKNEPCPGPVRCGRPAPPSAPVLRHRARWMPPPDFTSARRSALSMR